MLPELQISPFKPPTEDQVFFLLILSVSGHDIGYAMTGMGLNMWSTIATKLAARARLLEVLKDAEDRGVMKDLRVEMNRLITRPWVWFTSRDPITIEWRYKEGEGYFYKTACEMRAGLLIINKRMS